MGGAGVLNLQLIILFSSGSTPCIAVSTYVLNLLQNHKIANSSQLIIVLTTFSFLTCHSPPTFFSLQVPLPVPLHLSLKSKLFFLTSAGVTVIE